MSVLVGVRQSKVWVNWLRVDALVLGVATPRKTPSAKNSTREEAAALLFVPTGAGKFALARSCTKPPATAVAEGSRGRASIVGKMLCACANWRLRVPETVVLLLLSLAEAESCKAGTVLETGYCPV